MSISIKKPGFRTALVALAAMGAALLALFALSGPATAGSTVFDVTKTADTNDGACTDSDCSLREAIVAANTYGIDNIDVPAGTYRLTIAGANEDDAATGDLDIRQGVAIRGAGARATIIDGNGIDRVFHMPTQFVSTPHTVIIYGVKITGGAAPAGFVGGGIAHLARGANLNLTESTVSGNSAAYGGGIHNGAEQIFGGTTTIRRSTISGNKATSEGGGIFNGTTLTLENTTVSGNQSNMGGGIMSRVALKITDNTVAFNTAQNNSGGVYKYGSAATLKNTTVSNNRSVETKSQTNCSDPVTSEGNNLEKGTSCGFDQPGDLNADPKLGPLQNNGGPTGTHALLDGSPATDAGGDPFPPTDQRGVTRPQGIESDIGAYEVNQALNVVRCPTGGSTIQCDGTSARDALVGRDDTYDQMQGGEGDDAYNGKGGCDALNDASRTSSDRYLVAVKDFCNVGVSSLSIQDNGGKTDVLDLSRFYKSTDFAFSRGFTNLHLDGPGVNDIDVLDFFTTGSIDSLKFSDKTLTAKQVKNMVV